MYDISYEACSLIFLLILLVLYYNRRHMTDVLSSMFGACILVVTAEVAFGITVYLLSAYSSLVPLWFRKLVTGLNTAVQYFVPLTFFGYYYFLYRGKWDGKKVKEWFYIVPVLLGLVLLAAEPLLHLYHWYDADGICHRGPAHSLIYLVAMYYFMLTVRIVTKHKNTQQEIRLNTVVFIQAIGIVLMVLELLSPSVSLYGFCFTICTFLTYFMVENSIDCTSRHTGILNRAAFQRLLPTYKEKKVTAMYVVALDNFKMVNNIIGSDDEDNILHAVAQKLISVYQTKNVFWLGNGSFVILERSEGKAVVAEELKQLLTEAGQAEDTRIWLRAGICKINPDDWRWTETDSLYMVDKASAAVRAMGSAACIELDKSLFQAIRRQEAIERAILEAIEQERLEVHYQPIYAQESQEYLSLEALSRLQVEGYGYIPPDEFIQIVEQNGSIVQLGLLVLKKVCECIKKYDLREKGIQFVEVNASMVQCIQEHFAEDVLSVLRKYDIEPSMLCLEVTESAMTQSQERLTENMNILKEAGVFFALDDYGSGYSNINSIIDLPFSIIKLDKHMVWAAFTDENPRNILEYTILMFRKIALDIVAEGVENQYQAQILANAGVQYFQGYLYAKPLPEQALITFLENHAAELAEKRRQEEEQREAEVQSVPENAEEAAAVTQMLQEREEADTGVLPNIAFCVSGLSQEPEAAFVENLCKEIKAAGYRLLLFNSFASPEHEENYTKGEESIYALLNWNRLSALIIMPKQISSAEVIENLVRRAKQNFVPVILLDACMENCYSVLSDGESAFEALVRHMIERHAVRNVRMLLGPSQEEVYRERVSVFQTVLQENHFFFTDEQLLFSEYNEAGIQAVLDTLLVRENQLPEAFLCADDCMAALLCRVLEERGYHVPEDILVAGFEGTEAAYGVPRLTTAFRDAEKTAEIIIEIIAALKQGDTVQPVWKIPYKVSYSQSCGCEPYSLVDMNERMRALYQNIQKQSFLEKQLHQMVAELTDNRTFKECVEMLRPYLLHLPYEYVAICMKEDYITWLGENEALSERPLFGTSFTGRMYRILCKRNEAYHKDCVAFATEKLLPVQDHPDNKVRELLFLPLHAQQSVFGYVVLGKVSGFMETGTLLSFGSALGHIFASLSKREEKFMLTEEDNRRDIPATAGEDGSRNIGLYNRVGFKNRLDMAMQEVMGMYAEAAVICIGLNHPAALKEGSFDGTEEEALTALAQALVKCSKGEAVIAKTEEDEFSVLFVTAGTAELKARAFIEQVKQQLKIHKDMTEQLFMVEFSYGIVTAVIDMDFHVEEIMAEADRTMRRIREKRQKKHPVQ